MQEELKEEFHVTRHSPFKPVKYFFDEKAVSALAIQWQQTKDDNFLLLIWEKSDQLVESIIKSKHFTFDDMDALKSLCYLKLPKILKHYDPAKGRIFTLLSISFIRKISASFRSLISHANLCPLMDFESNPEVIDSFATSPFNPYSAIEMVELVTEKAKNITIPFEDELLARASKALIEWLLESSFELPRSHANKRLQSEFGLNTYHYDQVYGFTIIALRRELYDHIDFTIKANPEKQNYSTLEEFKSVLTQESFDRLLIIAYNVSARIITIKNLQWVLNGTGEVIPRTRKTRVEKQANPRVLQLEEKVLELHDKGLTGGQIRKELSMVNGSKVYDAINRLPKREIAVVVGVESIPEPSLRRRTGIPEAKLVVRLTKERMMPVAIAQHTGLPIAFVRSVIGGMRWFTVYKEFADKEFADVG